MLLKDVTGLKGYKTSWNDIIEFGDRHGCTIAPLCLRVEQLQLRYIGHVSRMTFKKIQKRILYSKVTGPIAPPPALVDAAYIAALAQLPQTVTRGKRRKKGRSADVGLPHAAPGSHTPAVTRESIARAHTWNLAQAILQTKVPGKRANTKNVRSFASTFSKTLRNFAIDRETWEDAASYRREWRSAVAGKGTEYFMESWNTERRIARACRRAKEAAKAAVLAAGDVPNDRADQSGGRAIVASPSTVVHCGGSTPTPGNDADDEYSEDEPNPSLLLTDTRPTATAAALAPDTEEHSQPCPAAAGNGSQNTDVRIPDPLAHVHDLRSAALASMTRKRTLRAAHQHALQHPVWQWQPGIVQETGARASFEGSIANTRSFEPSPTLEYNSAADLSNDEMLDVAFLCHGPTPLSGESSNDSDSQPGPSPNPLPLPPPNQPPALYQRTVGGASSGMNRTPRPLILTFAAHPTIIPAPPPTRACT